MLDLSQWAFHVFPAQLVREYGNRSVGRSFLQLHAPKPVACGELGPAVADAYAEELVLVRANDPPGQA